MICSFLRMARSTVNLHCHRKQCRAITSSRMLRSNFIFPSGCGISQARDRPECGFFCRRGSNLGSSSEAEVNARSRRAAAMPQSIGRCTQKPDIFQLPGYETGVVDTSWKDASLSGEFGSRFGDPDRRRDGQRPRRGLCPLCCQSRRASSGRSSRSR